MHQHRPGRWEAGADTVYWDSIPLACCPDQLDLASFECVYLVLGVQDKTGILLVSPATHTSLPELLEACTFGVRGMLCKIRFLLKKEEMFQRFFQY